MLFFIMSIYLLSGPLVSMYRLQKKRSTAKALSEEASTVNKPN
jgi:hypothetical protein